MQDLKVERTKRVKNIKALLGIMGENLEYYETLDKPERSDLRRLNEIELSLKKFLE